MLHLIYLESNESDESDEESDKFGSGSKSGSFGTFGTGICGLLSGVEFSSGVMLTTVDNHDEYPLWNTVKESW